MSMQLIQRPDGVWDRWPPAHDQCGTFSAVETDTPGEYQQASQCPQCGDVTFRRYLAEPGTTDTVYLWICCDHCKASSFHRGEFQHAGT